MAKRKLAWRFRKGSEADPIITLPCGCKEYVYEHIIVNHCEKHRAEKIASGEIKEVE